MESSRTMAYRAATMLACLVLLPLAAVFGTSIPEVATRWFERGAKPSFGSELPGTNRPPFDPLRRVGSAAASEGTSGCYPSIDGASGGERGAGHAYHRGGSLATSGQVGGTVARATTIFRRQPLSSPDPFAYIQQRLRALGVTDYLLETWGMEGEFYRFYGRATVGGNPDHSRYFEATDRDPFEAMIRVLADVESWRAGR